jgi:hypothetical protein
MRTARPLAAAAIAAAALTVAACSGNTASSTTAPQQAGNEPGGFGTSAAIANPVPILRLTGCPVPAGEKNGTIGVDADRTADCTFPGTFGEEVWVFTYPTAAYRDNRLAHPLAPPQDYEYTIKGPGASLIIVDRTPGFTGPSPQQIAARVDGAVLP